MSLLNENERWRNLPGWIDYEISSYGRIRHNGKLVAVDDEGDAYLVDPYEKGWVHVPDLVAKHFKPVKQVKPRGDKPKEVKPNGFNTSGLVLLKKPLGWLNKKGFITGGGK